MADTSVSVKVEAIKEFIDGFSKLTKENQLVLLGILKGMAAVNDVNELQDKGA